VLTVNAPAPVQYTLSTAAGPGGTVTAGGTYMAGTVVWISASPQGTHEFVGWTGATGGMANPVAVTMDGDKTVQANFALRSYSLTTSVSGGGTVTAGGSYPFGSVVSVSASADATHYFAGWSGDATGTASPVTVLVDRAKNVQAVFAPKAAQTILFSSPGNQPIGTEVVLSATSSAGLPVAFELVSGPASLSGNALTVTGVGAIMVRAIQPGDATRLPAVPVAVNFNGVAAAAVVRVQKAAKTLLALRETSGSGQHFVLGNP
jgi:hypothetical protein